MNLFSGRNEQDLNYDHLIWRGKDGVRPGATQVCQVLFTVSSVSSFQVPFFKFNG